MLGIIVKNEIKKCKFLQKNCIFLFTFLKNMYTIEKNKHYKRK